MKTLNATCIAIVVIFLSAGMVLAWPGADQAANMTGGQNMAAADFYYGVDQQSPAKDGNVNRMTELDRQHEQRVNEQLAPAEFFGYNEPAVSRSLRSPVRNQGFAESGLDADDAEGISTARFFYGEPTVNRATGQCVNC
jgi:hypothetical protein